jgi:hypothetical protein
MIFATGLGTRGGGSRPYGRVVMWTDKNKDKYDGSWVVRDLNAL